MKINATIIKPVLTEKATQLVSNNIYTFEVVKNSTKQQIAHAVESLFSVKVLSVKIILRKGKTRRVGRKMNVKLLSPRKIAYVRIKEGSISLFPKT